MFAGISAPRMSGDRKEKAAISARTGAGVKLIHWFLTTNTHQVPVKEMAGQRVQVPSLVV